MAHPFQCLLYCHRPQKRFSSILIAASGSYIHAFDVVSGLLVSSWSASSDASTSTQGLNGKVMEDEEQASDKGIEDSRRPTKRRKTSSVAPPVVISAESSSAEIVLDVHDSRTKDQHSNPVIKLATTSNGEYVIAVTSEDKCMRVFELADDGLLHHISERIMPKRPCAVILTPDDTTILCADKFGDVYSLPLLGDSYDFDHMSGEANDKEIGTAPKAFVPAASVLTVHSKRNRDALKQQQNLTQKKPEKKSLAFDYQLLLGHVSLLTDVIYASTRTASTNVRDHILTSDRDEHIRVSRGIPQAHIIEGYCLGHTQFISKLCIIPSKPQFLISGGGDDFLLLWEWAPGVIKQKVDLRRPVEAAKKELASKAGVQAPADEAADDFLKIAVSNIRYLNPPGEETSDLHTELIVTLEGIPALLIFSFNHEEEIKFREAYPTEGNVLDVAILQNRGSIIYSMDNLHKPFSTTDEKDDQGTSSSLAEAVHFLKGSQRWEEDINLPDELLERMEECAKSRPLVTQKNVAKGKSLSELLYGLEGLRKREMGGDVEEAA